MVWKLPSSVSPLTVVKRASTALNSGLGKKDCLLKSGKIKHTSTRRGLWICLIREVLNKIGGGKSRDGQSRYLVSFFLTHPCMCMYRQCVFWIGLSITHGFLELAKLRKLSKCRYAFLEFIAFLHIMGFNNCISLKFREKENPQRRYSGFVHTHAHTRIYTIHTLYSKRICLPT